MWKSRLCYLLVLLCTSVFFICYNGYISLYVFVLSLLFPVFAFLLSCRGFWACGWNCWQAGRAPAPL